MSENSIAQAEVQAEAAEAANESRTTESRSLVANSVAMVISRLLTPIFGWAGSVVIARTLSPDDWGMYSFIFGLLGVMAVVTDLGVGRVVIARLADADQEQFGTVAGSFISLRIALGFLGHLIALVYALIIGLDPWVLGVVALAGATVSLATPGNAYLILFQSRLKLVYTATWDVLAQIAQFALILVVMWVHPALWAFVLPPIAKEIVVLASRIVAVRRGRLDGLRPTFGAPFSLWLPMLREAIPISIGLALITVLTNVDTLMLERLDTIDNVGLYAIGTKFASVLVLAVSALAIPFTTAMVRSWGTDAPGFRSRSRQSFTVAAVLGGLAVVGFVPSSTRIVSLLYGEGFEPSAEPARLLVLSAAFSGITMIAMAVLVSAQRLRAFPWFAGAGVALNIALNLVLIPRMSMEGAAVATLATEALLCLALLVLVRFSTAGKGVVPWGSLFRQAIVVVGIAVPSFILVEVDGLPWIAVTAVACVVHVLVSFASGSLDRGIRLPFLHRGAEPEGAEVEEQGVTAQAGDPQAKSGEDR